MKRICFVSFFALMFAVGLHADPISKETALKSAKAFLLKHRAQTVDNLSLAYSGDRPRLAKGNAAVTKDPCYYVFNSDEGGFVIVSGDDATEEILGYSDNGHFDASAIPENMKEMLACYQEEISYVRSNGMRKANASSTAVTEESRQVIEPLVDTKWGQDNPYNKLCFTTSGKQAVTGCVATAMAQIMYYHKWPQDATAEIPGYDDYYEALPATTFEWEYMKTYYSSNDTIEDASNNAVAKLMQYCGHSVEMSYGTSGSGANVDSPVDALKTYFGYSKDICFLLRSYFTTEQWDNIVYNELYNQRPVIYSASNRWDGHAFICDGYDGHGLFHINWGWDGKYEGYYRLQTLFPQYAGSYSRMLDTGCFSYMQAIIVGISPEENIDSPYTEVCGNLRGRVEGFTLLTDEIDYTNRPSFSNVQYKFNYSSPTSDPISLGFGLYKDGELIQQSTLFSSTSSPVGQIWGTTFKFYGLGANLEDGNYQIKGISKMADSDTWLECLDADRFYVDVLIANGKAKFSLHKDYEGISITKVEKVYHSSTNFLRVYFKNVSDLDYRWNVYLYNNSKLKGREVVSLEGGQEDYTDFENNSELTDTLSLGIYFNGEDKFLYKSLSSDIPSVQVSTTNQATLVSSDIRCIDADARKMYGKIFEGTFTLRNDADIDFSGNAVVTICYLTKIDEDGAVWSKSRTFSTPISIKPHETKEVIVSDDKLTIGQQIWYTISIGGNKIDDGGAFDRITVVDGYNYWNEKGECDAAELTSKVSVPAKATAVNFEGLDISGKTITPNSNPNTIYYFDADATVPTSLNGKNVVKGCNVEGNFTLRDGYDFFVPKSFTVDGAASYERTTTIAGNMSQGWSTIVLPYAVDKVMNSTDNKQIDWCHASDSENKDFWLKEFYGMEDDEVTFEDVETWKPNEPYIISVPNGSQGLVGKKMVFSGTGVKVFPTKTCAKVTNDNGFIGTTTDKTLSGVYVMNEEGSAFEYSDEATVKAGRAYFISSSSPAPSEILICTVLPGDVNGDGLVAVSDVVLAVNYILGEDCPGFIFKNADLDNDNTINITDINGIIKIILGL